MNEKDVAEQAYKNGYEQAKKEFECNTYCTSWKAKFLKAMEENAELQKQVDELTAFKNEAISLSLYGKGRKDGEEVAVKDTAKEILAKAPTETNADEMFIHWLRERYGVEVE